MLFEAVLLRWFQPRSAFTMQRAVCLPWRWLHLLQRSTSLFKCQLNLYIVTKEDKNATVTYSKSNECSPLPSKYRGFRAARLGIELKSERVVSNQVLKLFCSRLYRMLLLTTQIQGKLVWFQRHSLFFLFFSLVSPINNLVRAVM